MEEELTRLIQDQARDDTHWQMPEPGTVSYDRHLENGSLEGFVRWFNRETRHRSEKTKKPKKRKLTFAQRELMALALIRGKYGRADGQEEVQPGAGEHRLQDQPGSA